MLRPEYSLKLRHIKQHLLVTSCQSMNFVSVFVSNVTAMTPNDSQSSVFASLVYVSYVLRSREH
jgi:hypothetical protein